MATRNFNSGWVWLKAPGGLVVLSLAVMPAAAQVQQKLDLGGQPGAVSDSIDLQSRSIDARLEALRSGKTGVSSFNLNFESGVLVGERLGSPSRETGRMESGAALLGADPDNEASRLGFFLGNADRLGAIDDTLSQDSFGFGNSGISAGLDYRFTDNLVFGAAMGYFGKDTGLGQLSIDPDKGYSLGFYGTYHEDSFYLDGSLAYGRTDRSQDDRLGFGGLDPTSTQRRDLLRLDLGAGYEFNSGSLSFGPTGRFQLMQSDDGRRRENTDGSDLDTSDPAYRSFTLSLGGRANYSINRSWGVLVPEATFEWVHEFDEESRSASSWFSGGPDDRRFGLPPDAVDKDYFNLGIGASALLPNGISAFLYYQSVLGHEEREQNTLRGGLRWDF